MTDPIRQAQREWEQAQKYLAACLEVWRANPRPDEAMRLAYAYDEERTLFEIYEGLCLNEPPAREEVVHQCPLGDSGIMPCCGKTPFEVPAYHRMAIDSRLVTCK